MLVVDSPEIPAGPAQAYFADALLQLGAVAGRDADQIVHIDYQETATCTGCSANTAEHVDYHGETIHLYHRWKDEPSDGLEDNLKHGLIHVLGFEDHLPAATHALMTPLYCDRTDHRHYQKTDVDALCARGRSRGGVCQ